MAEIFCQDLAAVKKFSDCVNDVKSHLKQGETKENGLTWAPPDRGNGAASLAQGLIGAMTGAEADAPAGAGAAAAEAPGPASPPVQPDRTPHAFGWYAIGPCPGQRCTEDWHCQCLWIFHAPM